MWQTGRLSNHFPGCFRRRLPFSKYSLFFKVNKYKKSNRVHLHQLHMTNVQQFSYLFFLNPLEWLMTMKTQRELSGWAQQQQQQQQTCGCVSFFFVSFFSMPTQRGRLKWRDYSSHERQHNSRVTFELYGDKKGEKREEKKVSTVQCRGGWATVFGKSSCYKGKLLLQQFAVSLLVTSHNQPLKRSVIHKNPPCQRSFLPQATTNTTPFFLTTINLLHSCLSKKKQIKKRKIIKVNPRHCSTAERNQRIKDIRCLRLFFLIFKYH